MRYVVILALALHISASQADDRMFGIICPVVW